MTWEEIGASGQRTFSPSGRCCRGFTDDMTVPRSGVPIDGNRWQYCFQSVTAGVEDTARQGENGHHAQGRAGGEAETSCTYCSWAVDDSAGDSYAFRAPMEGLCRPPAYWSGRNASREGT